MSPASPHDEFFKEIFGDPDRARDFITGTLPSEVLEILDLSQIRREPESFLTAQLAEDFADLVFSCPIQGGNALVALLLEHKSWAPRHPHLQLLAYMLGIWEQAEKEGRPLPPVIPLVLYNGPGEWKVRSFGACLPEVPEVLHPFLPEFQFVLLDLARESVPELQNRFHDRSVRLALELMRAIFSPSDVSRLIERLSPEDGPPDRDLAFRFLRVVLRYIFRRSGTTVREALALNLHPVTREQTMTMEEEILRRGEERGVERGIEQGLRLARLDDARKMVAEGCDWSFITRITGLHPEDLS
ncbi:MAG TPA: Rpn family recombination-promoting nuclease/putative transposase [Fibrobacteria bacterium]|nr:Rpn family recombination-promoting nuclease/putative transposase [Fibrobacteria bacterium]